MSLLADIRAGALEPEYQTARGRRDRKLERVLVITMIVALLAIAVVQTTRSAGDRADERSELVALVQAQAERNQQLESAIAELETEISDLRDRQLSDPALVAEIDRLEPVVGAEAVTGPGIVVTVDDGPESEGSTSTVLDSDLSLLVNGLWQAGAEAIAINGRRVTTSTPIRAAGVAITVDYVSLSPPYRVEVIGDLSNLEARFARTPAASWWFHISRNFGIGFDITRSDSDLDLPAIPRWQLEHSERDD